jgi:cell division septal protein FtsQ
MRSKITSQRLSDDKKKKFFRKLVKRGLFSIFALGLLALGVTQAANVAGPVIGRESIKFAGDYLGVKEFAITGASDYADKDIRGYIEPILKVNPNLLTLPFPEIKSYLVSRPYISRAEIRKEFPGRLVIAISEKKSVALLVKNGGFSLLDESGEIIRPMSVGENIDVPIVTIDAGVSQAALADSLRTACHLIQLDNKSVPYLMPSEIRISGNGMTLRSMELKNSDNTMPPIYFSFDGIEKKVLYVKKLWPELLKKKNEIEYIDSRFRQGVVVKLKTTEVKYNG